MHPTIILMGLRGLESSALEAELAKCGYQTTVCSGLSGLDEVLAPLSEKRALVVADIDSREDAELLLLERSTSWPGVPLLLLLPRSLASATALASMRARFDVSRVAYDTKPYSVREVMAFVTRIERALGRE